MEPSYRGVSDEQMSLEVHKNQINASRKTTAPGKSGYHLPPPVFLILSNRIKGSATSPNGSTALHPLPDMAHGKQRPSLFYFPALPSNRFTSFLFKLSCLNLVSLYYFFILQDYLKRKGKAIRFRYASLYASSDSNPYAHIRSLPQH